MTNLENKKAKKRFDWAYVIIVVILLLFALIIAYPFYNSFLVSIVPQDVYVRTPFLLYPPKIELGSYKLIFQWQDILYGFRTTIFITVVGTAYNLLLTVSMAYALNKPVPGKNFFHVFVIVTMYFGGGLIPFYLLIKNLGLINSYGAMILPYGINIMYMLIMQSYFRTIPPDLEESAKLDGASDLTILFRIVLPLSLPMLATIALYYGVDRWNEWYNGMLFIRSREKMPLQLHIRNMLQAASLVTSLIPETEKQKLYPQGLQMAGVIVTMLPIACVYPFLQRYFVKGLVLGAVKS